jgi:hypothetical protein
MNRVRSTQAYRAHAGRPTEGDNTSEEVQQQNDRNALDGKVLQKNGYWS